MKIQKYLALASFVLAVLGAGYGGREFILRIDTLEENYGYCLEEIEALQLERWEDFDQFLEFKRRINSRINSINNFEESIVDLMNRKGWSIYYKR